MADHCTHTFRRVVKTYKWANGSPIRSYRLRCKSCGHSWTIYYDTVQKKEVQVDKCSDGKPLNQNRLTPDQVRTVLLDSRSSCELGRVFGVSHQSISQIRNGQVYKTMWPDIPRKNQATLDYTGALPGGLAVLNCRNCAHWWQRRCGLDIPEAGGAFASECSCYQEDE